VKLCGEAPEKKLEERKAKKAGFFSRVDINKCERRLVGFLKVC
jgi:hypothetical protein